MYIDSDTFYGVLVTKLYKLLCEKEKHEDIESQSNWALTEALNPHKLQEGGTFLSALDNKINVILSKMLVHIIEFLDNHQNFDLYEDEYLHDLWIGFFQSYCFKYQTLAKNEDNESKLPLLFQKYRSVSLDSYKSHFPFSWVIMESIEVQWNLKNAEKRPESITGTLLQ